MSVHGVLKTYIVCAVTAAVATFGFDAEAAGQSKCRPDFPLKDGWLGGDSVYSVPLTNEVSLWLFGDSFVGKAGSKDRRDARLIANSIALSTCNDGLWDIRYHWRTAEDGASPFFDTGNHETKYWPLHGFVYDGILNVFVVRVRTIAGQGGFNFELTGVDLIRIPNSEAPPDHWTLQKITISEEGPAFPGAAVVLDETDSTAQLATFVDGKDYRHHPVFLTRLPLPDLAAGGSVLETLTRKIGWRKGLHREEALMLLPQGSTEMSLRFHARTGRWLAVHTASKPFSPDIVWRSAKSLTGPWSEERLIVRMPEMIEGNARYKKDVFCYAAKEHPQFEAADQSHLVLTYACNSFDFDTVLTDLSIYRPQVMRLPVPEVNGE